jgi:DNA polymerase-4
MPAICLDCADRSAKDGARVCTVCRSPRLRRHPELETLSIAHIDCDAFYAAIEKRDNPSLADKPLIVGGGKRGVVSTCCYIARTFGVKSAMPMFKALKACPDAIVLKPDMEKYAGVSREVKRLMLETTPMVQSLSLDEAFLDLTGTARLHRQPPAATLVKLARRIENELGITVSIGLASNKFLAKFASERDKPRGFFIVGSSDAMSVLGPCPPGVIFGVGKVFGQRLAADGIVTLKQVQDMNERDMIKRYGDMGGHVWRLARGQDSRRVDPETDGRGMSAETTFNEDIADPAELDRILWTMCERLSARAKASGHGGATVTLKLRTEDFRVLTRRATMAGPTQLAEVIYRTAHRLLIATADGKMRYRLIGVGIAALAEAESCDLFDLFRADEKKTADAEHAIDKVRAKFGRGAIIKGRAL